MIRRYTVNYELNRLYVLEDEQYWGTQKDLSPFLLVKYLKECWHSEVYLAFLLVATFDRNYKRTFCSITLQGRGTAVLYQVLNN